MKKINAFFTGIIAALGALALELLLLLFYPSGESRLADLYSSLTFFLLLAVLIEEFLKFIFLLNIYRKENGAIFPLSVFFGAGFSFAEIFFLHFNELLSANSPHLQLAGVAAVHIATSGLIGWLLAKFGKKIKTLWPFFIFAAFLIHFSYNAAIISSPPLQNIQSSTIIKLDNK